MTRAVFLVFAGLTVAAGYLTVYGVGAESLGIPRSVRGGSVGNASSHSVK